MSVFQYPYIIILMINLIYPEPPPSNGQESYGQISSSYHGKSLSWSVIITRETPAFGGISLALQRSGAFGGGKRKKIGVPAVPHSFKNFSKIMRIPNMCLVLKLDNGKVVSIANEQNHRQTDRITELQSHPVPY